ncbi:hypothetical protein TNCV_560081, partial [Trichonephila clavipes]
HPKVSPEVEKKEREIGMARERAENREGSLGFPGCVKPVFTKDSKPLGRRKRSLGAPREREPRTHPKEDECEMDIDYDTIPQNEKNSDALSDTDTASLSSVDEMPSANASGCRPIFMIFMQIQLFNLE